MLIDKIRFEIIPNKLQTSILWSPWVRGISIWAFWLWCIDLFRKYLQFKHVIHTYELFDIPCNTTYILEGIVSCDLAQKLLSSLKSCHIEWFVVHHFHSFAMVKRLPASILKYIVLCQCINNRLPLVNLLTRPPIIFFWNYLMQEKYGGWMSLFINCLFDPSKSFNLNPTKWNQLPAFHIAW